MILSYILHKENLDILENKSHFSRHINDVYLFFRNFETAYIRPNTQMPVLFEGGQSRRHVKR
jgi:hypothetical protein